MDVLQKTHDYFRGARMCVCVCALSVYTHVRVYRTRGVPGHIFVFQWYTYAFPTCTHMCFNCT